MHRLSILDVRLWTYVCTAIIAGPALAVEPYPGTQPLEIQGDLADLMVQGIDRFLLQQIDASVERRARYWKRDFSSAEIRERTELVLDGRFARIVTAADALG